MVPDAVTSPEAGPAGAAVTAALAVIAKAAVRVSLARSQVGLLRVAVRPLLARLPHRRAISPHRSRRRRIAVADVPIHLKLAAAEIAPRNKRQAAARAADAAAAAAVGSIRT